MTTPRVSTGFERLDAMLGGGLLPGTLTVVYGATGIGKTHLGLGFADHGRVADGRRGLIVDMNARGDSQQHVPYAARLHDWTLERWTHAVLPMTDPYPPAAQLEARYLDVFPWVGRRSDYEVTSGDGREFEVHDFAATVTGIVWVPSRSCQAARVYEPGGRFGMLNDPSGFETAKYG